MKDRKMGRIHFCENCDTKCDDTYTAKYSRISWGQSIDVKMFYYCSEDCASYDCREGEKPLIIKRIKLSNKWIPIYTELLSDRIKSGGTTTALFESLRHLKALKRALEMLLSRQHTYAELAVAFHKARDAAYALSEVVQDLKKEDTDYLLDNYETAISDVKFCDGKMTMEGLGAWL